MLLDTDVLVDILRKHPPAVAWFATLTEKPLTSGFSAMELVSGCLDAVELTRARRFLAGFNTVWPGEDDLIRALNDYAPLRQSYGVGVVDALIATTAVGLGLPLATFNTKHFRAIHGFTTTQPYVR